MKLNKKVCLAVILAPLFGLINQAVAQLRQLPVQAVEKIKKNKSVFIQGERARLHGSLVEMELDSATTFDAVASNVDEFGLTHVKFQQRHAGLTVWNGMVISHLDATGEPVRKTIDAFKKVYSHTKPELTETKAIGEALAAFDNKAPLTVQPTVELVIYPVTRKVISSRALGLDIDKIDATMVEDEVQRFALAYHVHIETRTKEDGVCVFHAKWPPVPRQTGHPVHAKLGHSFHAMADSRSVATRGCKFLL